MPRIIPSILALACLAAAPSSRSIQDALNAMPRSDGIVSGRAQIGGTVELLPGTWKLTKPITLASAQTLAGKGANATILEWLGPKGTSAIVLHSFADHGTVHRSQLRDLSIHTPNGADAIGYDASVKRVESLNVERVVMNGGGVALQGLYESYFIGLADVEFREPTGAVLRLTGQGHRLSSVRLAGAMKPGHPAPSAMIEVSGSVSIGGGDAGWSRLEGVWPCPLLHVKGWRMGTPAQLRGMLVMEPDTWVEPNKPGVAVVIEDSAFVALWFIGGHAHVPYKLVRAEALVSYAPYDVKAVVVGEGSKITVAGAK